MAETSPDRQAESDLLNGVFHALGDPSRRRIIALLREAGELNVGDIATAFSMTLNGVSKHLKVLEKAGLVVRRVEGRRHWIRVHWPALQPAYSWLHAHHHFWSRRLDALVDYVQLQESAESHGPLAGDSDQRAKVNHDDGFDDGT